jgi:hypothetical protein
MGLDVGWEERRHKWTKYKKPNWQERNINLNYLSTWFLNHAFLQEILHQWPSFIWFHANVSTKFYRQTSTSSQAHRPETKHTTPSKTASRSLSIAPKMHA